MDHAGYLAAVLCFNRNTVTAVPGSDESVLQIGMQGAVHHAGKLGMDAVGGYGHAAADMLQPGACIICDFFFGKDTAVNFIGKKRERLDALEKGGKGVLGRVFPILSSVIFNTGGVFQKAGDSKKLRRGKGAADFQGFQAHAQLAVAAEGYASFFKQAGEGVTGLHLGGLYFLQIRHGHQFPAQFAPGIGGGMFGEAVYDFVIFKSV